MVNHGNQSHQKEWEQSLVRCMCALRTDQWSEFVSFFYFPFPGFGQCCHRGHLKIARSDSRFRSIQGYVKITYYFRLHLRRLMRKPLRTLKPYKNAKKDVINVTWNVFDFFISNVYIYFWRAHWLISKNSKFRVSNMSTIFRLTYMFANRDRTSSY